MYECENIEMAVDPIYCIDVLVNGIGLVIFKLKIREKQYIKTLNYVQMKKNLRA